MRIWRLMGLSVDEGTAFVACAGIGGVGAAPYTPDFNGRLVGLRTVPSGAAATSLLRHMEFRLGCAAWSPNTIEVGVQGSGIETALFQPNMALDWSVDQPVVAGTPITVESRNVTAATPITVECLIYGCFEVAAVR